MEKQLSFVSCLLWIVENGFVTENGKPVEFAQHRFLIDPFEDYTPHQIVRKSAQIGWSTLAIFKTLHLARYAGFNVIYTLPSSDAVSDFVRPKVNPIVARNPVIRDLIVTTEDAIGLKRIGDRYVYYRGSWTEREAITISGDILINDELDRSNPHVIRQYRSRLDASSYGWIWQFSNPTLPGFGVDGGFLGSDQKHWFVTCSHCSYKSYLDWLAIDEKNDFMVHYVDTKQQIYACGRCHKVLTDEDRMLGEWVQKFRSRSKSGYWVSQLIAPWIPAVKIVQDWELNRTDPAYFYNFIIGKAYQRRDVVVDRSTIVSCLVPGTNPETNVAIGVDNGIIKHYVIGNEFGIFLIGATESWEEIERLRNRFNAHMVIDANPYPTQPKKLAKKYPNKVFIHYYSKDRKGIGMIRWGKGDESGSVISDRTKIIDLVVSELHSQDLILNFIERDLEDYIVHWTNMYRLVEDKNADGTKKDIPVIIWKTPEGKPDHYAHSTVLWRVAMEKAQVSTKGGGVRIKKPTPKTSPTVSEDFTIPAIDPLEQARKAAKARTKSVIKQIWKSK